MFGIKKASPCIVGHEIPDVKEDLKNSIKLEDKRLGNKAIYFYLNTRFVYIPYYIIDKVSSMVFNEHHSCCSGDSTMEVYKLLMNIWGKNFFIEFSSKENCDKAVDFISEKLKANKSNA